MTAQELLDFNDNERIDWTRVAEAVAFYEKRGYRYIEVPWVVPPRFVRATLPSGGVPYRIEPIGQAPIEAELVGSAEQSFWWLENRGGLRGFPTQRFVGVSPCFRGDERSPIHQKTFMKVELFIPNGLPGPGIERVLEDSKAFFESQGVTPIRVNTANGIDWYAAGIEIGSYGRRVVGYEGGTAEWVYGTGLAEPRFSQALAEENRGRGA